MRVRVKDQAALAQLTAFLGPHAVVAVADDGSTVDAFSTNGLSHVELRFAIEAWALYRGDGGIEVLDAPSHVT